MEGIAVLSAPSFDTDAAILVFGIVAGVVILWFMASREHRSAISLRSGWLDGLAQGLPGARVSIGASHLPKLEALLSDGRRVEVELIVDSLQCRRLPQLWISVTVDRDPPGHSAAIGALARPTGAEFYSRVQTLPDRFHSRRLDEMGLLVRTRGSIPRGVIERTEAVFAELFRDPTLKEAVVMAKRVRILRQAAEGDRGSHLLMRQMRFPLKPIDRNDLLRAVAEADLLIAAQKESFSSIEDRAA